MSPAVALTVGMRNALFSIGDLNAQTTTANKRLATGKKVNDAIDNPLNYFMSRGFQKARTDLANLLDSQNIALNTLQKTVKTIESISKLVEQAQALARQARQSTDDTEDGARETYGRQIAETLNQITNLTRDAGFNGKNLIGRTPDTLRVEWNAEVGGNLTFMDAVGVDLRPNGTVLNMVPAPTATTGFAVAAGVAPAPDVISWDDATATTWQNTVAGNTQIDTFITNTANALVRLQANASQFSVNLSVLQVRIDFSNSQQRTLATASDQLTLADMNEEGANLAALQTRGQLAVQALSLANQSDQGILRLF
jgi:flagellin